MTGASGSAQPRRRRLASLRSARPTRLLALLLIAGCDSGGPAPQLDAFARALVCDLPGASFDVHGTNLGRAHIELQRVETAVGVAVSEPPLTPPSALMGDYLHVELDGAPQGAYDVTAVAGVERWTSMRGLGILPPPSVAVETPSGLCNAQAAQTLTVHGSGFVVFQSRVPRVSIHDPQGIERFADDAVPQECVPAVTGVIDGVQLCDALQVTLPPGQLDPGLYYATVEDPAPLGCVSTETRPFLVNAPPSVNAAQTTAQVCRGGGSLVIVGSGFLDGATVALGGVAPETTTVVSDHEIRVDYGFVPLFTPGQPLSLIVANPDGCRSAQVAVTVAAGPVLLAGESLTVHRALRTPITLHLSSLTGPLDQVTLDNGGTPVPLTASISGSRVIAEVPPNLAAGTYEITVADASGCGARWKAALRIVDDSGLQLDAVVPAFGLRAQPRRLAISGAVQAGARVFLSPQGGGPSVAAPAQLDGGVLHALVPANIAAAVYDVYVVNPDGSAGSIASGYQAVDGGIPTITRVAPQLPVAQITVDGSGFGAAPQVTAVCRGPGGARGNIDLMASGSDTQVIADGTPLAALLHGTACTLRVSNGGIFAESDDAVVVAGGLAPVRAGDSTFEAAPSLSSVRRAPAVTVGQAEPGSRFVYALGGDGGTLTSARSDGEFAPLGPAGVGAWAPVRSSLPSVTTLAGAVTSGRFVFVVGGHDGSSPLARVARAEVLDPMEAPEVSLDSVALDGAAHGLAGGATYYYRVAALYAADDLQNPLGESLASPPLAITLAPLAAASDVTVTISGGAGRKLSAWRVYRGTAPDQIDRYVDVPASFTDDDTRMSTSQVPLPLGALGRFMTTGIPQLTTPRAGAAVTAVADAVPGRSFLYAAFGWDGTALPASYEMAQLDGGSASAFSESALAGGRWLCGAWAVTPERSTLPNRYVYFGQGTQNLTLSSIMDADSVAQMDAAQLDNTGALTPFAGAPVVVRAFGYGAFSGGDSLVMAGGAVANDQPTSLLERAALPSPQPAAWTSHDFLPSLRFLPGVAAGGPYLIVVGGGPTFATASSDVSIGLY
jgi:hypothetical protein